MQHVNEPAEPERINLIEITTPKIVPSNSELQTDYRYKNSTIKRRI